MDDADASRKQPMTLPLPLGFVVELNFRTRVRDGGRTLIGGFRPALYLSRTAMEMLIDGR